MIEFYEINSLREQLELMEKDYREQIFHLNLEISNLREKGQSLTENSYLIEELQAINEAQVLELQSAQIDVENLKLQQEEIDFLKQQLSNSLNTQNNENDELLEARRINEDQMFELETLRVNMSQLEESYRKELDKVKHDSKSMEQFYQAELEMLNAKYEKLSVNERNHDLVENLQLENEALVLQIETLKLDIEVERESSNLILETQTSCITEALSAPSEEVKELKTQIEFQSAEIKSLVNTIEELKNAEASVSIESNDEFQNLKSEITKLSKENGVLKTLSNENEGLKIENKRLFTEVESLKLTIDETKAAKDLKISDLVQTNEELQQKLESIQIDYISSQEDISAHCKLNTFSYK